MFKENSYQTETLHYMHKTDLEKRLGEQTTSVRLKNAQMLNYMKGEQK